MARQRELILLVARNAGLSGEIVRNFSHGLLPERACQSIVNQCIDERAIAQHGRVAAMYATGSEPYHASGGVTHQGEIGVESLVV